MHILNKTLWLLAEFWELHQLQGNPASPQLMLEMSNSNKSGFAAALIT